ncbi:MAG: hypothetical protein GF344_02145 [Chitinivibrionales bacterium]|nr:hypothetical protein [Chitinivibrionales bacterium]MBD3355895.1 hypothetical protein [Chitinivibrionales bacterium]
MSDIGMRESIQDNDSPEFERATSIGLLKAGISHDIRNSLNWMMLRGESLYKRWKFICTHASVSLEEPFRAGVCRQDWADLSQWITKAIEDMQKGCRQIEEMLESLQSYVNGENPKERRLVDLNHTVEEAVRIAQDHIRECTRHFSLCLDPRVPVVRGRTVELEQIVLNLIINACQSLRSADRPISVFTSTENDRWALLAVKDGGEGIAPEDKSRIFEPFFTTRARNGGTGMGLAMVRKIVHGHGGEIGFESALNEGSCFVVRLPLIYAS